MKRKLIGLNLAAALLTFTAAPAVHAEVVIGVSASLSGPGSSLGIRVANAVKLLPQTIGDEPVRYLILDDASDPAAGAKNVRKMATEDKVDAIIGSSTVPVAISGGSIANEENIPFIAIAPIAIDTQKQPNIFAVPQPVSLMAAALVDHMNTNGVKKLGYIGFTDSFGDLNYNAAKAGGKELGIDVITNERYARNDISVNSQMLKIVAEKPDAIFVGAAGTPGALPQLAADKLGYKQPMYQTHGVVNQDFIRVAGPSAEGVIAVTGPVVVADQLPDEHPLKEVGTDFLEKYEGAYGEGSRDVFAGYAWDAGLIIQNAIPEALKSAKPGTPEFRQALRDAIEGTKNLKGTHAVYSMSPDDHHGVDERARVLVTVKDGQWALLE